MRSHKLLELPLFSISLSEEFLDRLIWLELVLGNIYFHIFISHDFGYFSHLIDTVISLKKNIHSENLELKIKYHGCQHTAGRP